MKAIIFRTFGLVVLMVLGFGGAFASVDKTKTAEDIIQFAENMEELDAALLKSEIKTLTVAEKVRLAKIVHKQAKDYKDGVTSVAPSKGVLYVLAIILPPVAVGLATDWQKPVIFNILWLLLGGLPGIIHALIVVSR